MFKALKTIKKIKQLQKEMHDVSHMLKDVLGGKSVDEAMKRLNSEVKIEEVEQEDDKD
ncbi:TPA: hypothetical protein VV390_001661 [Streptococcus pneumoniae]|uniref:hypothetical protein n=1 Tax=Streptococcus pneumoniae TaxID=1313 RepID=UPI0005E17000|nr:hypothetical protein [Streptococcus pneumoniae]CKH92178.1 Uncharacterised protein [Streptococcus pneumoniae]HEU6750194.1 hypothetical protein [Streptococcus pneumoniae]